MLQKKNTKRLLEHIFTTRDSENHVFFYQVSRNHLATTNVCLTSKQQPMLKKLVKQNELTFGRMVQKLSKGTFCVFSGTPC